MPKAAANSGASPFVRLNDDDERSRGAVADSSFFYCYFNVWSEVPNPSRC